MKNPNTDAPQPVRDWLAGIGRKGGSAGDPKDKRRAARKRWRKAKAAPRPAQPQSTL